MITKKNKFIIDALIPKIGMTSSNTIKVMWNAPLIVCVPNMVLNILTTSIKKG